MVTNTLADRDVLIGQVIDNLNVVLGSLGGQTERLDLAVTSLSELVQGLAERKGDISTALAYTDAAAGSVAGLLAQSRQPFAKVVRETDRTAAIALADHEYLDNLINTLPDKYRALGRQGINGDFFSFYLCEIVLKLNGKGGQPVYVKVADQVSGGAHRDEILHGAQSARDRGRRRRGGLRGRRRGAAVPESAPGQSGQDLLGSLRRRRRPAQRGHGGGLRISGGQGVVHRARRSRGAGALQRRQEHPNGRGDRGRNQDEEPAGNQDACRSSTGRRRPRRAHPDEPDQLAVSAARCARRSRRHHQRPGHR